MGKHDATRALRSQRQGAPVREPGPPYKGPQKLSVTTYGTDGARELFAALPENVWYKAKVLHVRTGEVHRAVRITDSIQTAFVPPDLLQAHELILNRGDRVMVQVVPVSGKKHPYRVTDIKLSTEAS